MATPTTFTANTQIKSAEVNGNFTGLSDGTMDIDHNSLQIFRDEALYDFVNSGGVWTADSAGVNRNASMTALVTTIDGWRSSIGAVTSRTFTASKDTYIDVLRTGTTTALVYTEVSNNAASPALASNSLRLGIIVTGATTIAAAASINQGQTDRVLPLASSVPYAVTDSLGNLICNRSATPTVIGYRQIISNITTTTVAASVAAMTGLTVPVIVPTGRRVKISIFSPAVGASVVSVVAITIWDGVAGSGTQVGQGNVEIANSSLNSSSLAETVINASGSKSYSGGWNISTAGTATENVGATLPAYIKVELV